MANRYRAFWPDAKPLATPAHSAVVIGAGIGGLAAGIELAAQGYAVTVVDKQATPGGKLRQVAVGPALVDGGPTVLTLRDVFDSLYARAGERLEEHLTLDPLPILARHWWPDGASLDLFADPDQSKQAIAAAFGPAESLGFERFLAHARRIWQTVEGPFVRGPRPTPASMVREYGWQVAPMLARIDASRSVWRSLQTFFASPHLRQLFGRYATYSGCSPFLAPATLNLIAWVEAAGVWQVRGGIGQLATALASLLQRQGGQLVLGCGVQHILTNGQGVTGVLLADGQRLPASVVVHAGDVSALGSGLLGPGVLRSAAITQPDQRSLSAVTWCMWAHTNGLQLDHHNVLFGPQYEQEFAAIFDRQQLPEVPTVYVCAQDRGATVPTGPERLLVLANAPAVGDQNQPALSDLEALQERTFAHLQRLGLHITSAAPAVRTGPADWERLFPASGGALYGAANHTFSASLQRPGAETSVPGLFLAGGTAHPGAGLPMAALSGRLAAQAIVARHGRPRSLLGAA